MYQEQQKQKRAAQEESGKKLFNAEHLPKIISGLNAFKKTNYSLIDLPGILPPSISENASPREILTSAVKYTLNNLMASMKFKNIPGAKRGIETLEVKLKMLELELLLLESGNQNIEATPLHEQHQKTVNKKYQECMLHPNDSAKFSMWLSEQHNKENFAICFLSPPDDNLRSYLTKRQGDEKALLPTYPIMDFDDTQYLDELK